MYLLRKLIIKLGNDVALVGFFVLTRFFYNANRIEKMSKRRAPISKDMIGYLIAKGSNSRIHDNRYIMLRD